MPTLPRPRQLLRDTTLLPLLEDITRQSQRLALALHDEPAAEADPEWLSAQSRMGQAIEAAQTQAAQRFRLTHEQSVQVVREALVLLASK
jgi:hypothetical protein